MTEQETLTQAAFDALEADRREGRTWRDAGVTADADQTARLAEALSGWQPERS